jgi:superfamily II DNA or RNA helicase
MSNLLELPVARWPHQIAGVDDVCAARADGHRIIILTSPTGGGKTQIMFDLLDRSLEAFEKSVLYTNRKMLTEQTVKVMLKHGIQHGVRAAGWEPDLAADVQVASIQTEYSKLRRWKRGLHEAHLVLVDEIHLNTSGRAEEIFRKHLEAGATIVGVTATPIDCGNVCGITPHLVIAGTNSDLRKCGALVRAMHFGPDEPDMCKIRKQVWEMTEGDVRKLIMVHGIFARVLDEFNRLNPEHLPTLLFAPGVAESIWFAEQFREAGIRSAHIDGRDCWLDGESCKSSKEIRERILDLSRRGEVKVICNRFVMREGIDAPWLRHAIFATVFSSLQSYLQSGGRMLRKTSGKDQAVIQDHGGNWHRHGSLNADRNWELDYTLSENVVQGLREERLRQKEEKEPFLCPRCKKVLTSSECPNCGFKVTRKSRPVMQADGTIRLHVGDIYHPRKVSMKSDTLQKWERCYYRAKNSKNGMNFNQAHGLFFCEEHYWCPTDMPLMPKSRLDWFRAVKLVPKEALYGYQDGQE